MQAGQVICEQVKERVSAIINMAKILNDLFDSSDDEENNMLFPFEPIVRNDDDVMYFICNVLLYYEKIKIFLN